MQQRWPQYDLIGKLVQKFKSTPLVLLGDFNTTGYNIKNEDFTKFDDLLTESSLYTVAEKLACTSYWAGTLGNGQHQSSILDHIIVKHDQVANMTDIELGSHCAKLACKDATPEELGLSYQVVSDHCPIRVSFK
jgi:endonuclease/exonuclease/phosphatase family metal-dependent hydrolase